jgi:hypothetical protein
MFESDDTDFDVDDDWIERTTPSTGKTNRVHIHQDLASIDCSHPASTIVPANIPGAASTIRAARGGAKHEHDRI